MDPRLIGEIATHHGLITRQRALELGLDSRTIDAIVRSGDLVLVRRGVYADPDVVATATTRADRQRLRDRAACLRVPAPFVRSHTTAALELGLSILLPPQPLTHVTQHRHGIRTRFGVKHHIAPYDLSQVVEVNGLRVLGPMRTVLDIAREHGHPYGVVAVDRARWLGHSLDEMLAELETRMRHWPDRAGARRALELSDPAAESVAETLGRMLLEELGLSGIETQFGLTDGRLTHYADLRVGRHLIEVDGRQKYVKEEAGGLAVRDIADVILEEKRREDWFRGFHLGVSRLVWADVWGPGRDAAKARLRRELARTEALWGTSVDDLARFRVTRRPAA